MVYVKCAECGEDTDVRIDAPHGGVFFCKAHEKPAEFPFGHGTMPPDFAWTRSEHQARLDEGRSFRK